MVMRDYAEAFTNKKKVTFEGIALAFLGVVCYISSGFMFSYAILGGF